MNQDTRPLRSGELARMVGVSPDTLRLYERKGLLRRPPRASNGYRCYSADAVARVRLIRSALSIGFTLDELAEILRLRDSGGVPCTHVRNLAAEKLASLEAHIRQLSRLRVRLRRLLQEWDSALKKASGARPARLLERLADGNGPNSGGLTLRFHPPAIRPLHKETGQ